MAQESLTIEFNELYFTKENISTVVEVFNHNQLAREIMFRLRFCRLFLSSLFSSLLLAQLSKGFYPRQCDSTFIQADHCLGSFRNHHVRAIWILHIVPNTLFFRLFPSLSVWKTST